LQYLRPWMQSQVRSNAHIHSARDQTLLAF
jgi:hypothetical protein